MSDEKFPIRSICVYCGSQPGSNAGYMDAGRALGRSIAEHGLGLVYGGGTRGIMGAVSSGTMSAGGRVTGIIPEFLMDKEASKHSLSALTEVVVTRDMHERKHKMFEQSDAFVTLPGGIGTLEELVEQLTWSQLGQHQKPIVVANIEGFWEPFLDLLAHMKGDAFIRAGLDVRFSVVDSAEKIVPAALAAIERTDETPADVALIAKF